MLSVTRLLLMGVSIIPSTLALESTNRGTSHSNHQQRTSGAVHRADILQQGGVREELGEDGSARDGIEQQMEGVSWAIREKDRFHRKTRQ
ncbi:hypothetical protein FOZ60_002871 [Perkinsus olseni]|uniref:Uncharacterized protein n=1 Tax=Perkinsus olseni TaxID=32597 RepID=A0A7J6NWT4_PEROL|nr:hypothetical protein FOZ60_002871 [Perkinsus olseni]